VKNHKKHINPEHKLNDIDEKLFEKADIKFKKSAADVLAEIKATSGTAKEIKSKAKVIKFGAWQIAAAIAFLVASSLIYMRVHSTTHTTAEHVLADVILPDGSKVKLNENSELSFNPYWWFAHRKVNFEGEAFFEVEKGSQFSVVSKNGTTSVLGTSFNINSRNNNYSVFCKTGRVMVENAQSKTVIEPNQIAITSSTGNLEKEGANETIVLSWTNGLLNFNNTSLATVFAELETQYGITIEVNRKVDLYATYTAIFTKPTNPIEALELICISNNLDFKKQDESTFVISNK
jgi:ferric-dicitrate binding protein FerR (iron transport regulator)